MFVFIDESGDPGFKLDKGSSPIFVATMVLVPDQRSAQEISSVIVDLRQEKRIQPEFKFNKCNNTNRDAFFQAVAPLNFTTRSVVVQKKLIHSEALRTVKESFYKFFIRIMIQNDGGVLRDAKVVIDGSGDRPFKRQFKSYLRRHLERGVIKKVELKDSHRDPLLQLADMAAGAVARSYHPDKDDANRWRRMLKSAEKIDNIWEFK